MPATSMLDELEDARRTLANIRSEIRLIVGSLDNPLTPSLNHTAYQLTRSLAALSEAIRSYNEATIYGEVGEGR